MEHVLTILNEHLDSFFLACHYCRIRVCCYEECDNHWTFVRVFVPHPRDMFALGMAYERVKLGLEI